MTILPPKAMKFAFTAAFAGTARQQGRRASSSSVGTRLLLRHSSPPPPSPAQQEPLSASSSYARISTRRHQSSGVAVEEERQAVATAQPNGSMNSTTSAEPPAVPERFGGPNGPSISNKGTIFDEIDEALGVDSPPDIEVILTDHIAYVGNPLSAFLHKTVLRFGHVAIRYTTSDGVQRVMNILGDFDDPESSMVNFVEPSDYYFGTKGFESFAQQGGVYNRPFVGLRIENVSPGATDALHAYYEALSKASEIGEGSKLGDRPGSPDRGAVRFQLVEIQLSKLARSVPEPLDKVLFRAADFFRNQHKRAKDNKIKNRKHSKRRTELIKPNESRDAMSQKEMMAGMEDARQALYNSGNCAQWTSGGLDFVGLIRRARLFPKGILVDLFEEEILKYKRPNNGKLISLLGKW